MNRRQVLVALWISTAPVGAVAQATDAFSQIDDPEVRACLQRTLPETALSESIVFRVFDDTGSVSESAADLYWKRFEDGRSRSLIRFTAPPHRAGVALLVTEREDRTAEPDMYVYLPELRTTRRIVGKTLAGSMFGTDFSYEDFAQMQGVARGHAMRRLADVDLDGREAYVIETTPQNDESEYVRILTFIDRQWCVPVATRFYGQNETLLKELIAVRDDVREVDSRWIPYRLIMYDREHGGRTEVVIKTIAVDPELRDLLFTTSELRKGR